ncbi:MAG: hypothetical protein WD766_10280, partial [Gemmatimonadota bacterium]
GAALRGRGGKAAGRVKSVAEERSRGFADPVHRARWIEEKGMTVLSFHSDRHRETPVDVFVAEPFDFAEE